MTDKPDTSLAAEAAVMRRALETCRNFFRPTRLMGDPLVNEIEAALSSTAGRDMLAQMDRMREHVRLLLPLAKGYVHAHPGIKSTQEIVDEADAALADKEPTT